VAKQKKRHYEVRGQTIIHYKRYVEYPSNVDAEEVRRRMEALQTPDTLCLQAEGYRGEIL
jgi:hypothetical protein